jgi:hypothetical protein
MKTIQIQDPCDKNNTLVYVSSNGKLIARGIIHCICGCEWEALDANGNQIDFFTSKRAALAALM